MDPGERHGAAQALPTPGHVIAGKYAIVSVLGEGGMGIVYEATHLRLHQRVAVKMLLPAMLSHAIIVTRFEREARAAGQLRNRHTARVMDVDVTPEGLPYMVMELLEGHDLQVELERRQRLPVEEAVGYVLQACSAMIEAHQLGIVHRDLKPANLYLAVEGDTHGPDSRIVKVLDFGISKLQAEGDAKLTVANSVMGTAMYMSPEQIRSSGTVDARSDIWSLGIILFELLAGSPPWIGTPTQLAAAVVSEDAPDVRTLADVPVAISAIIAKALRRDPRERFETVKQLALALAPFAPETGAARVLADTLLNGTSTGGYARVSIRASDKEEAHTLVQAPAVSESRMRAGEPSGTAPGWSQHSHGAVRSRTLLVGFAAAFSVALLVIGAIAMAWVRWGKASATHDGTTTARAASTPTAPSPAPEPLPPALEPPPVPAEPAAAPSSHASPPSHAAPSAAPRPRGTARPPTTATPAAPAAPAKPVPASPGSNPLLL
jgi:serine/threonine protein kinase